jgi:hypothetical protein
MSRINKVSRIHEDTLLREGILIHLSTGSLPLDGKDVTAPDIVPKLDERIAAAQTTATKHAEWLAAVAAEKAVVQATAAFVSMVRQSLRLKFKSQQDVLTQLGLQPRKQPRKLDAGEVSAKVALQKATRKARGTLGTRQRAKIKGKVPETQPATTAPTPPTAPTSTGGNTTGTH